MQNNHQEYSTALNEYTEDSSLMPLLSRLPKQQIGEIGITGLETAIIQVPSADNGYAAICSGKVTTWQGSFSGIGITTPDMVNGSNHPNHLIHAAEMDALKMPLEAAINFGNARPTALDVTPTSVPNSSQKKFNPSASKPMSDKQRAMLTSMTAQQGTTIEAASQKFSGKPVEKLTTRDAHELMETLRNRSTIG